MARLIKLSDTKWKQLFKDRKSLNNKYWSMPTEIADNFDIKDGARIDLRIQFPDLNIQDIKGEFPITSGREIYFPKEIQDIVDPIVRQNRDSYYVAEIIINMSSPQPEDYDDPAAPDRIKCEIYRILRDTKLSRSIKELHDNRCQICGSTIHLSNRKSYSEAHHIKPLGKKHEGPDVPENIIVLCPNHHAMLDYGAIRLDIENIQKHPQHNIGEGYVDYHNDCIYRHEEC